MSTFRTCGAVLLFVGFAFAQAQDPAQEAKKVKATFDGVDLEALAREVEKLTRKTFVFQEQLLKGKKVTLRSETSVTPDELYRIFQSLCLMHGLALVPVRESPLNLVKIVPAQQAAKESGAQLVLSRGEDVPAGEAAMVYYIFAPRHLTSGKALPIVTAAMSPFGAVQQVPNSDLLLIIDTASAIERIEKVLSRLDQPKDPVSMMAVTLENISAALAKGRLTEFSQAYQKALTGEAGTVHVEIVTDDRLNQIHLIGREADLKRAAEFLTAIDRQVPAVKRTIGYYKLKNVPVKDITPIVRQFLGLSPGEEPSETGRTANPGTPLAGPPTLGSMERPVLPETVSPPLPQERPRVGEPQTPTARGPASNKEQVYSDIEVIPLPGLNTLAVIGNQAVHDEVKKILENLDKRKGQILIEVAIVQVTGDDSLDTGLEVLFEDQRKSGALVNGGTGFGLGTQGSTTGSGFPNVQNLPAFTGGAFRYLKPDDISVLIRMIATKANVNILNQPSLVVNDNEDANFTTKVSEPTLITSQGTTTTLTSFAGFAEAVTSLTITPQLSPDGYINLKITQSFEEFSGAGGAGVPPPKVSNNVSTILTVPDLHTVIMGGFTRDALTDTTTGVPVLSDIPLVGALFSQRNHRLTKSRLYLFVRPRILSKDGFADLKQASMERVERIRPLIQDERMKAEVRRALLPGDPGIFQAPLPLPKEE